MFLIISPIVINVPSRDLLSVETMHAIVQWLANLNNIIKKNMTSMFVNKKHRYLYQKCLILCSKILLNVPLAFHFHICKWCLVYMIQEAYRALQL